MRKRPHDIQRAMRKVHIDTLVSPRKPGHTTIKRSKYGHLTNNSASKHRIASIAAGKAHSTRKTITLCANVATGERYTVTVGKPENT